MVVVVGAVVLGLLLPAVLAHRRLYVLDQGRTGANQSLRAGMDLMLMDARQAGERLPADFPALLLSQAPDGSAVLVLRRNLSDTVLTLCQDAPAGATSLITASSSAPAAYQVECAFNDLNGNGVDDRIDAWQNYRCGLDRAPLCQGNSRESAALYLYSPGSSASRWSQYIGELSTGNGIRVSPIPAGFLAGTRLYLLEERTYTLQGGVLQLSLNGAPPQGVVSEVQSFQAQALSGGVWRSSFPPAGTSWTALQSLSLSLTAQVGGVSRSLATQVLPRNTLSR